MGIFEQMLMSHLPRLVPPPPSTHPNHLTQTGRSRISHPAAHYPSHWDPSLNFELHSHSPINPAQQTCSPACPAHLASWSHSHHSHWFPVLPVPAHHPAGAIFITIIFLQLVLHLPLLILASLLLSLALSDFSPTWLTSSTGVSLGFSFSSALNSYFLSRQVCLVC